MLDTFYKIVRFVARLSVFLIALLALLGALVVGVTQFGPFRDFALQKGLEALNGQLQARVEVGSVSGNLITGLTLHEVRLIADSTTMIDAPTVELHYQLRPILSQQVAGARVYLYRPVVRLVRNRADSTWNFSHITKPAVDSVKTPFNWNIDVQAFEIINGTLFMHDLTQEPNNDTTSKTVDYAYLDFQQLNMALQAHVEPTTQSVRIQHLSFNLPRPNIHLLELATELTVDTTGLTIQDFRLETERTTLALNGKIDSVNFLGVQESVTPFQEYPMEIHMKASRVSTLELARFVPSTDFLGGDPELTLDAKGTLGDLLINRLHVGLDDDSQININGRITNLDDPDNLYIDAKLTDTRLSDEDARTFVPGLNLPDLRYLGRVEIKEATYQGAVDNFTSKIDASTEIGSVRGGIELDLRRAVAQYTGDVAIIHGNLAPVLDNQEYASDFTGRAVINGEGFSLDELNAKVRLESQASTFAGRTYRKLYIDGEARRGGYIRIDTLLLTPGSGGNPLASEMVVDTTRGTYISPRLRTIFAESLQLDAQDRALFANGPFLGASGWVDLTKSVPDYDLSVHTRNLNIEDLTLDAANRSNLTLTLKAAGQGFQLDDLEGNGTIIVQQAQTPDRTIPPFQATYTLTREDARHRTLEFTSDFADATISGEWRPEAVLPALSEGFSSIIDYIQRKSEFKSEPFFTLENRPFNESVDMHYELTLRDLSPLELVMGGQIEATGNLKGDIIGSPQILSISAAGKLDRFRYRTSDMALALDSTTIDADLRGITPGRVGEITSIDISVRSDSAVRYNDLSFRSPEARIELQNGELKVHGVTAINNQVSFAVDGVIDVNDPLGYRAAIDTLIVALPNGLRWRNQGQLQAVISKDRIQLDSFAFKRRNGETVAVQGTIAGDRLENVEVRVLDGSLASLPRFIYGDDPNTTISSLSGSIRDIHFTLNGTFDKPEIIGTIAVDSLAYSDNGIGDLRATLNYGNQNLTGNIAILNAPLSKSPTDSALTVTIAALPIDLAFASREERFLNNRPVSITARSNKLALSPVGRLLPGAVVTNGTADLNFTVDGALPNLNYSGKGVINNGRVLIEGNNITYLLPHAELAFVDEVLVISSTRLRNDPRDYPRGAADIYGRITFDGFSISQLDIQAETEGLLVLSNATQAVNDVVYGDLVIASENGPIRFYGSLDQPRLTGDISVILGDLIFPESQGRETNVNVVKYIDFGEWEERINRPYGPDLPSSMDTSASKGDTLAKRDTTVKEGGLAGQVEDIRSQLKDVKGLTTGGKSITDLILMDLNIRIPGRMFLEMQFSPIETLEAEISTEGEPLQFRRGEDGENHLIGTVQVLPGSRYNFLKTFDASGTLQFTDKIDNVRLDLVATHTGKTLSDGGDILREYTVIIRIGGTKDKLDVEFDYTVDGRPPAIADKDEKTRNAISLLLFGRLTSELISSGSGSSTSLQDRLGGAALEGGAAYASTLSSSVLSELLGSSRFIRSVGLDLGNRASGDEARISVITQFGQVLIRYSGQISSPTNSTITVEAPAAALFDLETLRNLALQLEFENAETNNARLSSAESQAARIRIQYRINF